MTRTIHRLFTLPIVLVWLAGMAHGADQDGIETAGSAVEEANAAAEPAAPAPSSGNVLQRLWTWSDMRLRGVFDPVLPDTQERKTWRLSLQPRFGDITRNDHIRIPVGFIYGFNARTDGEIEFEGYLANPLEDGTGAGISNVRGTLKRLWTPGFDPTMKAAVGVGFECPIEGSPYWLVDGVNRYTTFVTFSRPSSKRLNMETFLNLTYEVLVPSSADGVIPYDRPQDDFVQITTGLLYRRDPFAYGLSLGWEHTVDGMPMDFYTITPSIIYDVPRRFSFKRPGRWQLGTAVEVRHWESETDVSVRLRVRWLSDSRRARSK